MNGPFPNSIAVYYNKCSYNNNNCDGSDENIVNQHIRLQNKCLDDVGTCSNDIIFSKYITGQI